MIKINPDIKVRPESQRERYHVSATGYFGDMDELAHAYESYKDADKAEMFNHLCHVSNTKFEHADERDAYIEEMGFDPDSFYIPVDQGDMVACFDDIEFIYVDADGCEHDIEVDDCLTFISNIS